MGKLFITHTMPSAIPISEVVKVTNAAKDNSNSDAYWVGCWIQLNDKGDVSKIICEWESKDFKSLKIRLEKIKKSIPGFEIDGPYIMTKIDNDPYG
jgi:hypothetical protein